MILGVIRDMGMDDQQAQSVSAILRDILAAKTSKNPSFSLRAFARTLGVSHTYLSLVLNEKKKLSMHKVVEFSEILGMDEKQRRLFISAATAEKETQTLMTLGGQTFRVKRKKAKPAIYFELEADRFKVLQEWYHIPLLDLPSTKDFKNDARWIAKRLQISTDQARSGIDRLIRLGLLEEVDGKLRKTNGNIWIGGKKSNRMVRAYHQQMINRALNALDQGGEENFHKRSVSSITMAIDPAKLPEAKKRLDKFQRSLWQFLSTGDSLELYQFNVQLFPLTNEVPEKGQVLKKGSKRGNV
jgi:uncharacterized protein (TIGR02147 family)